MKPGATGRLLVGSMVVIALLAQLTSTVIAAPRFNLTERCERRPDHPKCATPEPNPTPTPTPVTSPTPTPTPVPSPTPTPTPVVTPTPGPTPTPPAGPWLSVFRDDFVVLDKTRYGAYPNEWFDTSGRGRYSGTDRMVHDPANQYLRIELGRDALGQPRSVAFTARLPGSIYQLYGRYEIRFKAESPGTSQGWKTSWLTWPQSEVWPRDGEIDFPEGDLNGLIWAFMHRQNATSGSDQDAYATGANYGVWHTAVIEWAPNSCKFILDGVTIGHSTSRVPNTPMRWVIQSETTLNSVTPSASAPILVDYLEVWRYQP